MSIRKTQFKIPILLFIIPCFLFSQSVRVEIFGNSRLRESEIIKLIQNIVDDSVSDDKVESIKERILNFYIENGFYFAKIESLKLEKSKVKIYINEGEQAKFGEVKVLGNQVLSSDDIIKISGFKRGEIFLPHILKNKIDRILNAYANIGYPLAKVEIDDLNFDDHGFADIMLNINEGQLVKIEQIKIEGNKLTREDFILREMKIKRGEVYREMKFEQIRKRLMKLGLFKSIEDPEIFISDTTSGILIKVEEGRMNLFDGVLGYVPSTGTSRGYFTGYINILLKNLFGTGRRFGARWNAETRETQEFEIHYFEPYVLRSPVDAQVSFYQRKQDSVYVVREPKLNLSVELTGFEKVSEILKASFYISQRTIIPTATEYIGYQIFESTSLNMGLGISYDSRDDVDFPRSGVYFSSFYELGNKKILGPERLLTPEMRRKVSVNKFNLALDFYFNFEKILKSVLVPRFNAMVVVGDGIDESDGFRFGGMRSLRGYREREFLATRAIWTNFEDRFMLSDELWGFLFFDLGYIYRPVLLPRIRDSFEAIKYGYGFGMRLKTGIGKLSLIYALGKGDSFKTGKIHVGIESEF